MSRSIIYILILLVITDLYSLNNHIKGIYTSKVEDSFPGDENIYKLIDGDSSTKFLTRDSITIITIKFNSIVSVDSYKIVSGNDAPMRDPYNWKVEISEDNRSFQPIDIRDSELWGDRGESRSFRVKGSGKFGRYLRFSMENRGVDQYGSNLLQIGEVIVDGKVIDSEIPNADFSLTKEFFLVGEEIPIINSSKRYDRWIWDINGGAYSGDLKERSPLISFNQPGIYNISLTVFDDRGRSDSKYLVDPIVVKSNNLPWSGFILPEIRFKNHDPDSKGSEIYNRVVNDPNQYIGKAALEVAKAIFFNEDEVVNRVRIINYDIESGMEPGIPSYLSGSGAITAIKFSSDHVERVWGKSKDLEKIEAEIMGVLLHELTHGYQLQPRGAGVYDGKSEYWAFIEGLADAVRIDGGFHKNSKPYKCKKRWLEGYTGTGYFYCWIKDNYDKDFLRKLNLSAKEIEPWSFEKAVKNIIGVDADRLWELYLKSFEKSSKVCEPRG